MDLEVGLKGNFIVQKGFLSLPFGQIIGMLNNLIIEKSMGKNKISRRNVFVKQLGLMGVAVSGIASVSAALPINSEDREKNIFKKTFCSYIKGLGCNCRWRRTFGLHCCYCCSKRRCENAFESNLPECWVAWVLPD